MTVTLRPWRPDEPGLVFEASMGTINWPGPRFTEAEARAIPEIAHYWELRPERGDCGVVAEAGADTVGLAWLVFFDSSDPGYGFVADGVPEFALWVREGWRRRGIGRQLLRAVLEEARVAGVERVSLSVEDDNPSRNLYLAEGFRPVPGGEEDGVMVREMAAR